MGIDMPSGEVDCGQNLGFNFQHSVTVLENGNIVTLDNGNISTQINWHVIFAWLFVLSRYLHCYIRLTSNHIPSRAKSFQFGLIVLVLWWIYFLFNYHF